MKALSLTQPWASLVVKGEKQIETRSWSTSFRGLIAIHASKTFPKWAKEMLLNYRFMDSLDQCLLPLGAIIGTVEIVSCISTNDDACDRLLRDASANEYYFGDYSEDRFAWVLKNPREFVNPIPFSGALSLWTVPDEVELLINKAVTK